MGRPSGARNLSADRLREKAEKAEAKARLKLAKQGVLLPQVAAVAKYTATIKEGQRDLTDRFARVQEAVELIAELKQVKKERAEHQMMQDVPGGKTGLVTFTYAKDGPESYAKVSRLEPALNAAIIENLVYISREMGQFAPDVEVHLKDGRVGEKAPVDYSCLSMEELAELERIAKKLDAHRNGKTIEPQAPEKDGWKD